MKSPNLSIFCPSHYCQALHYASLTNLISIAQQLDSVEVIISDNSCVSEKSHFLRQFETQNIKIIEGPKSDNYFFALKATKGEYVVPCGDDDFLLSSGLAAVVRKIISNNSEGRFPAGYSGIQCVAGPASNNFVNLSNLASNLASERVRLSQANSKLISFVRRDIALEAWGFWFNEIPLPLSCYDLLASAYISVQGSFDFIDTLYFILDEGNNRATKEALVKHEVDLMVNIHKNGQQVAPSSYAMLAFLDLAVCGYFMFSSSRFSFLGNELKAVQTYWVSRCFHLWRNYYLPMGFEKDERVCGCACFDAVMILVKTYQDRSQINVNELLHSLGKIRDNFNGTGDEFVNFWQSL